MSKIRVLLVDDEQDALDLLESLLLENKNIEIIEKISNPLDVECSIIKNKPDAIFLDIKMPKYNGLELLKNIRKYQETLPVIYITAYNNYGIDAVKLNAFDYILKPVSRNELSVTIDKLFEQKKQNNKNNSNRIKLPVNGGFIYIKHDQILYLKAKGNYTDIFLTSGENYTSSYNMGRLNEKINSDNFKRINRHLIANSEYLLKINKSIKNCLLKSEIENIELPISNTFIRNLKKE